MPSADSAPTLSYFDLRGRAEASRLLLIDQGTEFVDHRVTSSEEWLTLQANVPFGALPLYADTNVTLTQSHAILRYLARTHGLVPSEPVGGRLHSTRPRKRWPKPRRVSGDSPGRTSGKAILGATQRASWLGT